jgi:hypothetical protein
MPEIFLIRAFAFLILPLILAGLVIAVDRSVNTRERKLEILMIYLFLFSAAGGIAGAMGHFFASDLVAQSIGWEAGSPFQLEMGFANLSFGILAAIAVGRRDGFREATVLGGAILSVGAFIVHLVDVIGSNNLAPGNTLINLTNLGRPALLIYLPWALRREERRQGTEAGFSAFAHWQTAEAALGGITGACVGIGLGIGLAVNQPLLGLLFGILIGGALGIVVRRRSMPG